jgi:hypothetical protein
MAPVLIFLNPPPSIITTLFVNDNAGDNVLLAHNVSSAFCLVLFLPSDETETETDPVSITTFFNDPCTSETDMSGEGGLEMKRNDESCKSTFTTPPPEVGDAIRKLFNITGADIKNEIFEIVKFSEDVSV